MGQGRGNSTMIAIMLIWCMLVFHSKIAHADTYIVGGAAGWTHNVGEWTKGKQFEEGDTFVFKYNPKLYNVVKVTQPGYTACSAKDPIQVYNSGNDAFMLRSGDHFFISGAVSDCQRGMKLALHVL